MPALGHASAQDIEAAVMPLPQPEPAVPRAWSISANISLATDWVARGLSETSEGPAVQGGFDVTNGWFYSGIYGSNLNFGGVDANGDGVADAAFGDFEADFWAGVKKTWHDITFDLAYFYYSYPNSSDAFGDVDLWEIRGMVSADTIAGTTSSFTVYYTPEYSFKTGKNWTYEGKLAMPLRQVGPFSPSLSALIGYNDNETGRVRPDFWFWNAGLTLGFGERFAFDLRYWDTDIGWCKQVNVFQCEERLIARLTATISEPEPSDLQPAGSAAGFPHPMRLSANVALTTDYVFRGQSQTDQQPAIQGGFEADYLPLYAGVWASNLNFGGADSNSDGIADSAVADIELDWYGGIKHAFGGIEVDLGAIYYNYPNAADRGAELDYWELKGGLAGPLIAGLEAGLTVFYAWEYTGQVGENWVFEGSLKKSLPRLGPFSPVLSGLLARNEGDQSAGGIDYWYWNAGLELGFLERFAFDIRYWDTDIGGCGARKLFQCDERAVATLSAEF